MEYYLGSTHTSAKVKAIIFDLTRNSIMKNKGPD